jgi:outer membrane protein assembly factor BamD (BamD/ComL family)
MARRAASLSCLILLGLTAVAALAADPSDSEAGRSQLIFDPKTQEWIEAPSPEAGTDAGELEQAKRLLAERKYSSARKALRRWFKTYPDSPLRPEALFYAADTEVYAANDRKVNDLWQAHEWYQEIMNGWAGTEWAERSMRRELIVAELFLFKGGKRKVFKGLLRVSARDEALQILDQLIDERAPGTPLAEQALLMRANYHFQRGEFEDAERDYARLMRDFPRGRSARLAAQRSADAALASFAGIEFDDAPLLEAEERYRQFAEKYPAAAEEAGVPATLSRIRDSRAEKEYSIAEYYQRAKRPSAASFYYRSVMVNWPDTIWAEKSRGRIEGLPSPAHDLPVPAQPESAAVEEPPTTQP